MGKVVISYANGITLTEKPYWRIQAYPDALRYDCQRNALHNKKTRAWQWVEATQQNLQVLIERRAVDEGGLLSLRFLSFSSYTLGQNVDPMLDMQYVAKLEDFQRLACTGSSYKKLPSRANKAEFWDTPAEAVLPRITQADVAVQFTDIW
jgi:hypothetical protein